MKNPHNWQNIIKFEVSFSCKSSVLIHMKCIKPSSGRSHIARVPKSANCAFHDNSSLESVIFYVSCDEHSCQDAQALVQQMTNIQTQ